MTTYALKKTSTGAVIRYQDFTDTPPVLAPEKDMQWVQEDRPVPPPPVPGPIVVSPRQIRQALTRVNLRDQVEAAVAAGDRDIKDWWEFATQVEENHPMVVGTATGLGVGADALHDLFLLAESL